MLVVGYNIILKKYIIQTDPAVSRGMYVAYIRTYVYK